MLAAHPQVEIVAEAASGTQVMALAAEHKPDLLLLDIQMPGGTGLDVAACLALRHGRPSSSARPTINMPWRRSNSMPSTTCSNP